MKIELTHYEGLNADGTKKNDPDNLKGSVNPKGGVDQSGKHQINSPSNQRDGNWLNISTPVKNGRKTVVTFYFDDAKEMKAFKNKRKASAYVI